MLLDLGSGFTAFHVLFFSPFNRIVDFSTMDWDLFGSFDAETHFVTTNFNDDNGDVVVDDDAFVFLQ